MPQTNSLEGAKNTEKMGLPGPHVRKDGLSSNHLQGFENINRGGSSSGRKQGTRNRE
jgi:hypothetical protein